MSFTSVESGIKRPKFEMDVGGLLCSALAAPFAGAASGWEHAEVAVDTVECAGDLNEERQWTSAGKRRVCTDKMKSAFHL